MVATAAESFTTRRVGAIAVLTLDRPAARNALDAATLTGLTRELRRLAADDRVEALVLAGSDPAFCAGLDLRELAADPERIMSVATSSETNPWLALSEMPQPVVGAVGGPAVTGGLELALVCDVLIASPRARFADTHARVGVLPAQGGPARLASAIGVPMAKYLTYTGEMMDADRALALGLVSRVVPHEQLLDAALATARRICEGHKDALREVKQSFDQGLLGDRREWFAREAAAAAAWQRRPDRSGDGAGEDPAGPPSDVVGRVTGFFHVSVTTSDLERSLRFYRDGLGLRIGSRGRSSSSAPTIWDLEVDDVDIAFLQVPGSDVVVELFEFHGVEQHPASSRPCDYASSHFCLLVDDAEAVLRRMVSLGYAARSRGVVTIEDGPLAGSRALYLIDPDGYHVELFQRPS